MDFKEPGEKSLEVILDCPTRWNFTYYMLQRLFKLYPFINRTVFANPKMQVTILSKIKIKILEDVIPILFQVEFATQQISADNSLTCSLTIPLLKCMSANIEECKSETSAGNTFKEAMIRSIQLRLDEAESNSLLSKATLLDTLFKRSLFTNRLDVSNTSRRICSELHDNRKVVDQKIAAPVASKPSDDLNFWKLHDSTRPMI